MTAEKVVNAALVVLAFCAIVVTGLVVRREFASGAQLHEERRPVRVRDWQGYAAAGHRAGPAKATVTVVEFSDYQCPFCRELFSTLDAVRKEHSGEVAVIHRHYPLPGHAQARPAAVAAECAAEQQRFDEMQAALYSHQDSLGKVAWSTVAVRAGVRDSTAFAACMASGRYDSALARDIRDGDRLGVRATPTLLVNDRKMEGALTRESLEKLIDEARR